MMLDREMKRLHNASPRGDAKVGLDARDGEQAAEAVYESIASSQDAAAALEVISRAAA